MWMKFGMVVCIVVGIIFLIMEEISGGEFLIVLVLCIGFEEIVNIIKGEK